MDTLQAYQSRKQALLQSLKDIVGDGSKPLSAEDRTRFDALEKEANGLDSQIKAAKEDAERAERVNKQLDELNQSAGRQVPSPLPKEDGKETHVRVLPPEQFRSFGEQLQAIAQAGITPNRVDNRLRWENLAPATGGAVAGVPSDGGYLIQKDFLTDLTTRMYDTGRLLSMVQRVPIGGDSDGLKLNMINETSRATGSRFGGVQVYWGAEADAATAKKPALRQMELELKDLIGLFYATNRLLADASALQTVAQKAFPEEMSFMVEDSLVNGLGAGQPLGVLNCGAMVSVAKETGQAAATFLFENAKKMWARVWGRSRANGVWIYNQDMEPQLMEMSIPVGTGGAPVFLPPGGISSSPYNTLFGRPMIPVEYCATLGTTGDIMFVDFSQYVLIEKGGIQGDSSMHVRFTTNEMAFRWIYRVDGQPTWNSALTPFKGSATQSPYVKLDTRS